jgi:hypothetical protein
MSVLRRATKKEVLIENLPELDESHGTVVIDKV